MSPTSMTELSPAAQAVFDASNLHPCKDSCLILAATLRAAAEQIEDLYCESDVDDSDGVVFAMRQLMLFAAELDNTSQQS